MEKPWLLKTKIFFGLILGHEVGRKGQKVHGIAWLIYIPLMTCTWKCKCTYFTSRAKPKCSSSTVLGTAERKEIQPVTTSPCLSSFCSILQKHLEWVKHEKGNVQEPEEEIQSEHQVLPPNSKLVVWTLDADQFIKWIAMCTYLLFMSAACWTGNLCGWDVLLYSWLHYPEEMQAISDPVLCIWGPHWVFELWSMNSFSEVNFFWCSISNLSFII